MGEYIAVYIPSPNGTGLPSGGIFTTLEAAAKCANTPEAKARGGARFKRFTSPDDAQTFVEHGDVSCTPESSSSSFSGSFKGAFSESIKTYPSVTPIVLNRLRRAIEIKDNALFEKFVTENPRCLVNTGSDKPTIIFEGCRYNALHVAAKFGNLYVVRYILDFVCNVEALLDVYGTSAEDVKNRSRTLLDFYLNTPDKGAGDTPLHFASKFGHKDVVELLLTYEEVEKERLNNEGKSAVEVRASRYCGADKADVGKAILCLFSSLYVPLYRPGDCSASAIICPPGGYPSTTYTGNTNSSVFGDYIISAVAGPFNDKENAQSFFKQWQCTEKSRRLRNPMKGAEEVGRILAKKVEVKWMERWAFSKDLIDLNSYAGLESLNTHLTNLRKRQLSEKASVFEVLDNVRKRLSFDEDEGSDGSEDDYFWDASDNTDSGETIDDLNVSDSSWKDETFDSNDSISFLSKKVSDLRLDDSCSFDNKKYSTKANHHDDRSCASGFSASGDFKRSTLKRDFPDSEIIETQKISEKSSHEIFFTPPTSPVPIYITGNMLTKEDEDLHNALSLVDPVLLNSFASVKEYIRKVKMVPAAERAQLPYADSPRAKGKKKSVLSERSFY